MGDAADAPADQGAAPPADAASPFGRSADSPWGATSGGGEWTETHTLGVGISPEIAARARARAAGGSPFASPFGPTATPAGDDAPAPGANGPADTFGPTTADPFGSPATAPGEESPAAPFGNPFAGAGAGAGAGTDPAPADGPAGIEAPSWGAGDPVAVVLDDAPNLVPDVMPDLITDLPVDLTPDPASALPPVDQAMVVHEEVGPAGGVAPDEAAAADGETDDPADGPAAIPPKRRRVRPGEVDPDVAPPSITPTRRGPNAPAGATKRPTRRFGVPPFADKPLVLALAGVLALGLGLGAGWAQSGVSGGGENLPPTTPQACAAATWAWAQSNSAQAMLVQEDPPSLRTGFIKARDALDGVTPPPAIAEDWGTVQTFITTMAAGLEPVDPADSEALLAAANEAGAGLDQQAMTEAAGRVQDYLSGNCAG